MLIQLVLYTTKKIKLIAYITFFVYLELMDELDAK